MSLHVAVAHYPEGAGHATRMMAVARSLEERGATVSMAGGGYGSRFYEPNGYDVRELSTVNYVRDFQDSGGPIRGLFRVLTNSLPESVRRLRELVAWLREEEPDVTVTDDMFAAMAAVRVGIPLYVLTHNSAGLYDDPLVRTATWGLTIGQRKVAKCFFYPTVWPPNGSDPPSVSRVPPIALRNGDAEAAYGPSDPGIVIVPSTYSGGFDALADRLRADGYDVTYVGREDWEPVPAMLPILRRADVVVCAGYSTIMETAVAGTPCIVWPETNEQVGVAEHVDEVDGFTVVDGADEVMAALEDPPPQPEHPNGDDVVAERILGDLET